MFMSEPTGRRKRQRTRRLRLLLGGVLAVLALMITLAVVRALHRRASTPTGQTLALVNGHPVTEQDLLAEARAQEVQISPALEPFLLQTVIARVLLAQAARTQRLDRTPGFPSDKRRADDQLLAAELLRRSEGRPDLSPAAVTAYEAANPHAFAGRRLLRLVRITYRGSLSLGGDGPPADVAALRTRLQDQALKFEDTQQDVFSDTLRPMVLAKLNASPAGALVGVQEGDTVIMLQLLQATPAPLVGADADARARAELAATSRRRAAAELATELARTARIGYRTGLSPAHAQPSREAH